MPISHPIRQRGQDWLFLAAFVLLYVLLDWISFIEPLFGLNITPWNPDPALGLVVWLRFGRRAALPWFAALVLSEWFVRGMPAGVPLTLLLSGQLVIGYGAIGELLRHTFDDSEFVGNRRHLSRWTAVLIIGLLLNGAVYIALLSMAGLVPPGAQLQATARFAIGDVVGTVVSMPLIWMLASTSGRSLIGTVLRSAEAAGYLLLTAFLVWGVFRGVIGNNEFKHFYLLFLPIIWAAARHGLPGSALVAFGLQFGIITMVRSGQVDAYPFAELQLLGAALALVGFFVGMMVDEGRQAAESMKQSLRLAAAGEMAAALAHELNQPMTALAAYGKACEHLLARGDTGPVLVDSIGKMVREAGRAAQVVHRLREFFRTGAMHLELNRVADIVATVTDQFAQQCAEQGVLLTVVLEPGLVLRADRLQIELVLRNLIANACDAVQGQAERRVTVTASALTGRRLKMSVRDSGSGVSPAAAARLFEPFVSGKSSGLGLGLVLCRAIVEAHGGRVWADIGDQGLFNVTLPLGAPGDLHDA